MQKMIGHLRVVSVSASAPALVMTALLGLGASGCTTSGPEVPPVSVQGFTAVPAPFVHQWDDQSHPFTGAAAIDIDGDNLNEVFVGGGHGQADALLKYKDGKLVDVIAGTGLSQKAATRGATSLDMDGDGDIDLLVARDDGVYLYLNDQGKFAATQIPVDLPPNSIPFDVAVSDIDRDGDGDLYVSVFVDAKSFKSAVYNDPDHAKQNRMGIGSINAPFHQSQSQCDGHLEVLLIS